MKLTGEDLKNAALQFHPDCRCGGANKPAVTRDRGRWVVACCNSRVTVSNRDVVLEAMVLRALGVVATGGAQ